MTKILNDVIKGRPLDQQQETETQTKHLIKGELIQVVYPDNKCDYVKDFVLDKLIEKKKIIKFLRKSGWATIGVDPIRNGKNNSPYPFQEKRKRKRAAHQPVTIEERRALL